MTEPEVATILRHVPEFAPRYLAMVEAADGDPGAVATFGELADFTADLAGRLADLRPVLLRVLGGVEEVAADSPDAEELVGWAFLDSLSPAEQELLRPWLGPATRDALARLEGPPAPGRDGGRP
ncbi:MAG: hypothetical protein KGJ77_08080 [Acidobacteriota bacterium]|nr:hypothetical protein [Acidobacteriota bacterium]